MLIYTKITQVCRWDSLFKSMDFLHGLNYSKIVTWVNDISDANENDTSHAFYTSLSIALAYHGNSLELQTCPKRFSQEIAAPT